MQGHHAPRLYGLQPQGTALRLRLVRSHRDRQAPEAQAHPGGRVQIQYSPVEFPGRKDKDPVETVQATGLHPGCQAGRAGHRLEPSKDKDGDGMSLKMRRVGPIGRLIDGKSYLWQCPKCKDVAIECNDTPPFCSKCD